MTGPVRLGLVGCGRLAERGYLPALRDVAGVRLAAVADPDPGRRTLLADMASTLLGQPVAAYDGIGGLLAGEQLDAVLIASPAGSHVADARAAAAAGVTALVEKPPAPDLAGAVELAGLARRPGSGSTAASTPAPGPCATPCRSAARSSCCCASTTGGRAGARTPCATTPSSTSAPTCSTGRAGSPAATSSTSPAPS